MSSLKKQPVHTHVNNKQNSPVSTYVYTYTFRSSTTWHTTLLKWFTVRLSLMSACDIISGRTFLGVWLCTKEIRTSETRLVPRLSGGQPRNKAIVQIIHRWSKTPWEVQDSMGSPRLHGKSKTPWEVQDSMGSPRLHGKSKTPWEVQDSMGSPRLHGKSKTPWEVQESMHVSLYTGIQCTVIQQQS